jgi:epoxyqueuosine reductase
MENSLTASDKIKLKAKELGFLECAIIPAGFLEEEEDHFSSWLKAGMCGEMHYMFRNKRKRLDPRLLLENAKTIILVLQNYYTGIKQKDPKAPVVSKYAYGMDYHSVMKEKLRLLLAFIQQDIQLCYGRPFVDSAPVLERAWARRAGLGWIGKNSNLISVKHGSFFFIGELILDIALPFDKLNPVADHCGTCTRCIDACPTNAIVTDRIVDARKCISYQTIELKGEIDKKLKGRFENRIFGCDICQDVCPWNRKSVPNNESRFNPSSFLLQMTKNDWYNLDKSRFNYLFKNSAVKRTGYDGLKRNMEFIKLHSED